MKLFSCLHLWVPLYILNRKLSRCKLIYCLNLQTLYKQILCLLRCTSDVFYPMVFISGQFCSPTDWKAKTSSQVFLLKENGKTATETYKSFLTKTRNIFSICTDACDRYSIIYALKYPHATSTVRCSDITKMGRSQLSGFIKHLFLRQC